MICPSCNRQATTLVRNAFSLQGVTIVQSVIGMLRCQHCSTLLKITSYGKYFWIIYIPAVIAVALLVIGHKFLYEKFGLDPEVLGIAFIIMIFVTFVFGMWKHAQVEVVHEATSSNVT